MLSNSDRVLRYAILAQAIIDVLDPGTPDEEAENAWAYLSNHDRILRKLQNLTELEKLKWMEELKKAIYE